MKAYKYHRYSKGAQVSMQDFSINEDIIYIPELSKILYKGYDGYHMKEYFGVLNDSVKENVFLKEAREYVDEYIGKGNISSDQVTVKELPKFEPPPMPKDSPFGYMQVDNRMEEKMTLSKLQELDLDITQKDINGMIEWDLQLKQIEANKEALKKKIFG